MLILTRKAGETIVIGDNIKVTILGINGSQVRVGIEAPKDITVHREEIYMRIQSEFEEAKKNKDSRICDVDDDQE